MNSKTYYIKKKKFEQYGVDRLLDIFANHSEIRVVLRNKDSVNLRQGSGRFYKIGEIEFINLNYLERFIGDYFGEGPYKKSRHYYVSNNSEMFHPIERHKAILALRTRVYQKDNGFRTSGIGGDLTQFRAIADRLQNMKYDGTIPA